jgi:hypothetical protein
VRRLLDHLAGDREEASPTFKAWRVERHVAVDPHAGKAPPPCPEAASDGSRVLRLDPHAEAQPPATPGETEARGRIARLPRIPRTRGCDAPSILDARAAGARRYVESKALPLRDPDFEVRF